MKTAPLPSSLFPSCSYLQLLLVRAETLNPQFTASVRIPTSISKLIGAFSSPFSINFLCMMISSLSSNVLPVSFPPGRNLAFSSSPTHFTLRFDFPPIYHTKLFSSPIDVAKEAEIKNLSKLDSVIDCVKNYGFSDADIQKLITKQSRVLKMSVEKNLKPKMEFLISIGAKSEDLAAIICRDPTLICSSLNNRIIPIYQFLKEVLVHDELVVKSLKSGSWGRRGNLEKNVVANFEHLKKVGVSESNYQVILIRFSGLLAADNVEFSERVDKIISLGFVPSKYSFVEAIRSWPTKSSFERKSQVFRSWGWSDSDILFAFKKNPLFIHTSVEKITAVMDFLVNKMGCDPSDIVSASFVFNHCLKKSVIPKCSVIRVLILKGLIGEEIHLGSFIPYDRKRFRDRYVFRYLEQVPELLDIFEGEVDLEELGFGFEEKLDTKLG